MRRTFRLALTAALLATCALGTAHAQPATADKGDAKALLASGLKLYAQKDYLGALAVFRDAYERFPSGKILLNIGTTLLKLDRKAEAANAYQGYLDSDDATPAKRAEVTKVLAELDRELGLLELDVTPEDAELQIGDSEWMPAARAKRQRVARGETVVRGRRDGYVASEQRVEIGAGERRTITIALAPEPVAAPTPAGEAVGAGVRVVATAERPRSRLGGLVRAHIDPIHAGGAGLVGLAFDVTERLQVQGAALIGTSSGGYAGVTFAVLGGRFRPIVSAGVPVFVSDGARVAVRGAGGVELALHRQLSLIAEVGLEHVVNPEDGITPTAFIPAIGAIGRL